MAYRPKKKGGESVLMILLGLVLTLFAYFVATLLYRRRVPRPWMNAILTTALAIMAVLVVSRVSYADYVRGAQVYTWLVQPATVAFAVPLYRYRRQLLRRYGLAMLAGVAAGSVSAVVSSVYFARWLHLALAVVTSLVPRSVTTPHCHGHFPRDRRGPGDDCRIRHCHRGAGQPDHDSDRTGLLTVVLAPFLVRML